MSSRQQKPPGIPPEGPTEGLTATPTPMLQVDGVSAGYGDDLILKNIHFSISPGERFVVLGESGCGKSTLLKAIVGLNPPQTGRIHFNGREIDHPLGENDDFFRRIGVLFQNSALLNSMPLLQNVILPIKMHHPSFPDQMAKDIGQEKLNMVGLYEARNKYPQELSGGMRKRGALARAMVMDPDIIFFDEPQAGLDPVTTRELDMLFVKLNEESGITYFIVTHELLSIRRTAQKVLMLADQEVLFLGSLEEADRSEIFRVRRFFNVDRYGDQNAMETST